LVDVCTGESVLYIYIRKPSVCWIFTIQIVRLSGFARLSNILERGCFPTRLHSFARLLAHATGRIQFYTTSRTVHYRLQNKSRSRYRDDIRQLSDNNRRCNGLVAIVCERENPRFTECLFKYDDH